MLTRRVLLTVKDPDGDVVGLGGDWGLTSKDTAVREMLTGNCRYYVVLDGQRLDVRAEAVPGGFSLTACLNGDQTNCLKQLPDG